MERSDVWRDGAYDFTIRLEEKNDALVLSFGNVYQKQNAGDPPGRDQVPIKYGYAGRYPDMQIVRS